MTRRNYGLFVTSAASSTPGVLTFSFSAPGGLPSVSEGDRRVDDGRWHHVAVVYDGPALTARYYVDGAIDVERRHGASLGGGVNDGDLLIGTDLVGWIDGVVVHDHVRTAQEIREAALGTGNVELCNGADDDGDGTPDDGFSCIQGTTETRACASAPGGNQTRICGNDCTLPEWPACPDVPADELSRSDTCGCGLGAEPSLPWVFLAALELYRRARARGRACGHARPPRRAMFVGLLLTFAVSCGPDEGRKVHEDRGTRVVSGVQPRSFAEQGEERLVWLSEGTEIAYLAGFAGASFTSLNVVHVADGVVRTLYPTSDASLVKSDLAIDTGQTALYHVPSSRTIRDAFSGREWSVQDADGSVAVSPDGQRIAYGTQNSVVAMDIASGESWSVPSCKRAWLFSPSGDEILCSDWLVQGTAFSIVDATTGERQGGMTCPSGVRCPVAVWTMSGVHALAIEICEAALVDVMAGTKRILFARTGGQAYLDPSYAAIASDGEAVAFWDTECLEYAGILSGCKEGRFESRVILATTDGAGARVIASGGDVPGPIAFSRDGLRLAYVYGQTLYVRNVR